MFGRLFSNLQPDNHNKSVTSRRRYARRSCDQCVTIINEKTYPVDNWSMGGLLMYGDGRIFAVNDEIDVTLRFKLQDRVLDIPNKARVVRKHDDKVAFQFTALPKKIKDSLQSVVDDYASARFAEGQPA